MNIAGTSSVGAPCAARAAATAAAAPNRCESPLLPMGQHPASQMDPDRLSQQLEHANHRQSQLSMLLHKSYAIPEDRDVEPAEGERGQGASSGSRARYHIRRPRRIPRPVSHRAQSAGAQASPVRELSSRLKSACRRLDPRRLAKAGHTAAAAAADAPPPPPSATNAPPRPQPAGASAGAAAAADARACARSL
ncbi:hypothetical protein LPJ61_000785 [Coemansia biformis]|uniref:Uncharacterized protein n=1 Tax=Coemansia biformis TaxID=1286918 RepID=A0A9W7YHP4_9FUNG|nr:hypothetical protein LPJ61_000785 [Coemansia biformis]